MITDSFYRPVENQSESCGWLQLEVNWLNASFQVFAGLWCLLFVGSTMTSRMTVTQPQPVMEIRSSQEWSSGICDCCSDLRSCECRLIFLTVKLCLVRRWFILHQKLFLTDGVMNMTCFVLALSPRTASAHNPIRTIVLQVLCRWSDLYRRVYAEKRLNYAALISTAPLRSSWPGLLENTDFFTTVPAKAIKKVKGRRLDHFTDRRGRCRDTGDPLCLCTSVGRYRDMSPHRLSLCDRNTSSSSSSSSIISWKWISTLKTVLSVWDACCSGRGLSGLLPCRFSLSTKDHLTTTLSRSTFWGHAGKVVMLQHQCQDTPFFHSTFI